MKLLQWPKDVAEGNLWAIPCSGCDMVFWFDALRVNDLLLKHGLQAFAVMAAESNGACRSVLIESEDEKQVCMTLYCPECEKELDAQVLAAGGTVENDPEDMGYFGEPGEA